MMRRLRDWFCRTSLPLLPLVFLQILFVFIALLILTADTREASDWRTVGVARDGTLFYQRYTPGGATQIFDLNMRPLNNITGPGGEPGEINMAMLSSSDWTGNGLWAYWDWRKNTQGEECWYWLEDEGYIAGYSRQTRRCFGYLGANGFTGDMANVVPFTALSRKRQDLGISVEGLFAFYAKPRIVRWLCRPETVRVIDFALLSPDRNVSRQYYNYNDEPDSRPLNCAVLTDSSVLIFDDTGRQTADIARPPWPPEDGRFGSVRVGMSDSGVYFLLASIDTGTIVRTATRDGRVLGDTVLPGTDGTITRTDFDAGAVAQPGVPLIITAVVIISGEAAHIPSSEELARALPCQLSDLWWYAAWYLLLLVGTLWLYRRHLRHQTLPRWQKWFWAASWFLFPFLAPFLYFGALDWPRLVKCPNCGQRRPIDRDQCPHCAAAFPRPPAKGIELIVP